MSLDELALARLVILLAPVLYSRIAVLTFFLAKLSDRVVTLLPGGLFNTRFAAATVTCGIGTAAFLAAGTQVTFPKMG